MAITNYGLNLRNDGGGGGPRLLSSRGSSGPYTRANLDNLLPAAAADLAKTLDPLSAFDRNSAANCFIGKVMTEKCARGVSHHYYGTLFNAF